MLRACGFKTIDVVHQTSVFAQLRSTLHWARKGVTPWATIQQGRAVVHARF
jgi:hypothetical protein